MKAQNLHLQYQPKEDRVLLVNHGTEPMTAYDCHEEFLYCVAVWGLRGAFKKGYQNFLERLAKRLGFRAIVGRNVREIVTKQGTLRVTVEHLS